MVVLAALLAADRRCRRKTVLRGFGVTRQEPIGRIDDDRTARLAVDPQHAIAGIDPERVVAADQAPPTLPQPLKVGELVRGDRARFATDGRRPAISTGRRLAGVKRVLRLGLLVQRLCFRQHQGPVGALPLEWSDGGVGPVPLQAGPAIARAQNGGRLGRRCLRPCGHEPEQRGGQREADDSHLMGSFRRCPYINSVTNSMHLNCPSRAPRSTRRYSGMLMVQGFENVPGSVMVAW